jgi:hypothetical protein
MNKYVFIKGLDQNGYDIYKINNNNINELINIANNDNNCIAFNTLGFYKSNIIDLKPSPYFQENYGIYIKYEYYQKFIKNIRIKMLCNWCSSQKLCNEFNIMSKGNYRWNNLEITSDNNVNYYVIINSTNELKYCEPNKTIIFQMEPWVYDISKNWGVKKWSNWAVPDENKFLKVIGRKTENEVNNIYWQLELNYNQLTNLKYENKIDEISTICSSKYVDEGHIHRINFLKYIEQKEEIKVNIFGYNNKHNFNNYKGQLYNNKSDGILPYKYYFMVENNYEIDYVTEKLIEPILCETLCFYYGCPNVTNYIDEKAFVLLDMYDFEKSYNIVQKALKEDWWSQRIEYNKKEKDKILNKLQFFPRIENIINKDRFFYYLNHSNIEYFKLLDFIVTNNISTNILSLGIDDSIFVLAYSSNGKINGIDNIDENKNNYINNIYKLNLFPNKNINLLDIKNLLEINLDKELFTKDIDILYIKDINYLKLCSNIINDNNIIIINNLYDKKTINELNFYKILFSNWNILILSKNSNIIDKIYNEYKFKKKYNDLYYIN